MTIKPIKERALEEVRAWIDGAASSYFTRVINKIGASKSAEIWEYALDSPILGNVRPHLVLSENFPFDAPRVYVAKSLFLKLPHVESDGKVCLGVTNEAADVASPISAVIRAIDIFTAFLEQCQDEDWIKAEIARESHSYWVQFCLLSGKNSWTRPRAQNVYLELSPFDKFAEGNVVFYERTASETRRVKYAVACLGDADPNQLAIRHGLSRGTMSKGAFLILELPIDLEWIPASWPAQIEELDRLVFRTTEGLQSLFDWLITCKAKKQQPSMVILIQRGVAFGYRLLPATIWGLTTPAIEPVLVYRIDVNWSLARDNQLETLELRKKKRIAILGCGSLGSPLIELLARAGVGELHLVDDELMEPENCSRHILGLSSSHKDKVKALASRLLAEIPNVKVYSHAMPVLGWLQNQSEDMAFDMVVDCTGESCVRTLLHLAKLEIPIVHGWLEPYGAAFHVVGVLSGDTWPLDDPAHQLINMAQWPADTQIKLPGCGAGFHQYGAADAWQAAAFTVEKIIALLEGRVEDSSIWSFVRSKAFFDALPVPPTEMSVLVPTGVSPYDASVLTRSYKAVVNVGT